MISQIGISALVAWFILWWEHWFPWQALLRRELPRVAAYILGTLAMACPLTGLFWYWAHHSRPDWPYAHLAALWVVIVAGGISVMSAYGIDRLIVWIANLIDENERLEQGYGK